MNKHNLITLTTDFGDDFALVQVIANLLSINILAKPAVISNHVSSFSIIEGAFMLLKSHNLFPKGTIHVGVVDPGVGTKREGVIIETKKYFFVGPNNGLFYPSLKNIKQIYRIDEKAISKNHSVTFHGRDIFAKAAGLISIGVVIESFARPLPKAYLKQLTFKKNQVLHVDHYGNIKINNNCKNFQIGDIIRVSSKDFVMELPFVRTFADVAVGSYLTYKGSHDILEVGKNLGSAIEKLKLKVGDVISITKLDL